MDLVSLQLFDGPDKAPNHSPPEYLMAKLEKVCIVSREADASVVELVFTDDSGKKYVAMVISGIIKAIAEGTRIAEREKCNDTEDKK